MIKKAEELNFSNKKLAVIIGGVAGIGKTTLGLSAPKPLLIDLDKGVARVNAIYRKDTDIVNSYDELISDLKNSDLSPYETIVIDTGGKLLEMMKPVVIREDAKNGQSDGTLTLKGYGAIKRKFASFVSFIKSLDKHLVFIFHATEVQLREQQLGLRIRIEGSSKDEIWDDIDLGGFIEMVGNRRTIGFGNTDRYYGKGTYGIRGIYDIPELKDNAPNNFLTLLFEKVQKDLAEDTMELKAYNSLMSDFYNKLGLVDDIESLNALLGQIQGYNHILTSKNEMWSKLLEKATELGATYDKKQKIFSDTNTSK